MSYLLQAAMFFLLGVFFAGLASIWIAPFIWRRASRITRKRIEASMPLSVGEIQAEKDQMRAEFAVDVRRIEMQMEALNAKAADDLVEINRQRAKIEALAADRQQKKGVIAEAEARIEELSEQTQKRAERITQLNADMRSLTAKFDDRKVRIEELEHTLRRTEGDLNSVRIELAASQTEAGTLSEKVQVLTQAGRALKTANAALKNEAKLAQSQLTKQAKLHDADMLKAGESQARYADLEERLERREKELKRLKEISSANPKTVSTKVKAGRKTLKVSATTSAPIAGGEAGVSQPVQQNGAANSLSQLNSRLDAMAKSALPDRAAASLSSAAVSANDQGNDLDVIAEKKRLETELLDLESKIEAKIKAGNGKPMRDAALLEQLNQVAADITAVTAKIEGANSPILDMVSGHGAAIGGGVAPKLKGFKPKSETDGQTLSDRISALHAGRAAE